jgi:hypothetical protein
MELTHTSFSTAAHSPAMQATIDAAFEAGRLAGMRQAHEIVAAQGGRIDPSNPIEVAEANAIDQYLVAIVDAKKLVEPSIAWKDEIDADDALIQLADRINPARRRADIIAFRGIINAAQRTHRPETVSELVEIVGARIE